MRNHPDPHPVCYTGILRAPTWLPLQDPDLWSFCGRTNIAKDFWILGQVKQRRNSHAFALTLDSLQTSVCLSHQDRMEAASTKEQEHRQGCLNLMSKPRRFTLNTDEDAS
ncbi:hypothetical protein KCU89_g121, partial [Aureobasidium melanogenum]